MCYGGGGGGGGGGDEMKELSIFLGTEDGDFYLFNAANQATTEQLLANGTIVMNDGSKHSTVAPADDADAWGLNIAKSTGTMTIYNEKGIGYVSYSLYRTGSMKGSIKGGDDLSSLSNLTDYSGAKGKATVTHSLSKPCKYVQITNTATGSLWFHGVKVYVVKDESSDGITTLISRPSSSLIYDLQGRRIAQPQPGQLYIMNGKKYVVK